MCLEKAHKLCGYVGLDCSDDEPLVKQEFVKESDVNVILARCFRQGTPLPGSDVVGVFADVSEFGDFAAARGRILAGENAFMSLPAEVRSQFDNDPARLVAFLQDPDNRQKAIKLGLVNKPVVASVTPPVVPAPPPVVVPPK